MRSEAYPHFKNKKTAPRHLPDFSAHSVLDIDFEMLQQLGIKHVLFDLDLTIRKPRAKEIEAEIITYLVDVHNRGLVHSLSLASNSLHRLNSFSEPLKAHIFQPFYHRGRLIRKPNPLFFERIITKLGADPSEIVMVGDKAMFDVAGGNRAGMWTILVDPQGRDLFHDRLLFIRFREKRLLRSARALAAEVQQG